MIEIAMFKDLIKAFSLFIILISILVVSFEMVVDSVFFNITGNIVYDSLLYVIVLVFGCTVVIICYNKYVGDKDE